MRTHVVTESNSSLQLSKGGKYEVFKHKRQNHVIQKEARMSRKGMT